MDENARMLQTVRRSPSRSSNRKKVNPNVSGGGTQFRKTFQLGQGGKKKIKKTKGKIREPFDAK